MLVNTGCCCWRKEMRQSAASSLMAFRASKTSMSATDRRTLPQFVSSNSFWRVSLSRAGATHKTSSADSTIRPRSQERDPILRSTGGEEGSHTG